MSQKITRPYVHEVWAQNVRKVCGSGRNDDTHTLSLSLWPNKEMLKKLLCFLFHSFSLSYMYIYTHACAHTRFGSVVWGWLLWRKLWFLHRVTLLSAAQRSAAGRTYTQTNTQELVLHPTASSTRFKSRRGNLNTEFHVFLRNVCPIHFGMCIHNLLLFFTMTKSWK